MDSEQLSREMCTHIWKLCLLVLKVHSHWPQESIPVGCQPHACRLYALHNERGGGSLYGAIQVEQVWPSLTPGGGGSGPDRGHGTVYGETRLWTDRLTDTHDWKHNLPTTLLAGGKNKREFLWPWSGSNQGSDYITLQNFKLWSHLSMAIHFFTWIKMLIMCHR